MTFFYADRSTPNAEVIEIIDVLTTKTSRPEIVVVDTDASLSSGFNLLIYAESS